MHIGDAYWMQAAYRMAALSDDRNTQNGAVIVGGEFGGFVASGANWIPRLVQKRVMRLERPAKYSFIEHAERAAIFAASCEGHKTLGATLYCPYAACAECARAIILAGIIRVVADARLMARAPDRWRESIEIGNLMLDEAGVKRDYLDQQLDCGKHLFDGEVWYP